MYKIIVIEITLEDMIKKGVCLPDEASPEGTVLLSHTPSFNSLSRISQLNMPGFSRLYSSIRFSTSGVATCFCVW